MATRTRRRIALAGAVAVAACAPGAAAAGLDARWRATEVLSPTRPAPAPGPVPAAVSDAGHAVVAWEVRRGGVRLHARTRDGACGLWRGGDIGALGGGFVVRASAAVAVDGAAVLVWLAEGPDRALTFARASGEGAWTRVSAAASPMPLTRLQTLDVTPAGAALLVGGAGTGQILVSSRPGPRSPLSAPQDLAATSGGGLAGAGAVNAAGEAVVAWLGADRAIRVASRLGHAGAFGPAQVVAGPGRGVSITVSVALSDSGAAVVSWGEASGPHAAVRPGRSAPFGAAERLGAGAAAAVALNERGDAAAVWDPELATAGGAPLVVASRRPAATGAWTRPEPVVARSGQPGARIDSTSVAIDGEGNVLAGWATREPEVGDGARLAAYLPAVLARFRPARLLAPPERVGSTPAVRLAPDGGGLAVWPQESPGEVPEDTVRAAPHDAAACDPDRIELSRRQLVINQRIAQAAVLRANAIDERLAGGLTTADLRDGGLAAADFGTGVVLAGTPTREPLLAAAGRPLRIGAPDRRGAGRVRLSARQLLVNQRIAQAAVRRANALGARLDAGLTGADVRDGAITATKLAPGLVVAAAAPAAAPPPAPPGRPGTGRGGGRVRLSAAQLAINQRISQVAVRRLNAIQERLEAGLPGDDIRDGTLTRADLAPALRP